MKKMTLTFKAIFFLLVIATAIFSSPIVVNADTTGLVAAYSFNEGSGTIVSDASGNGNTGTVAGATWIPAGRFGNALVFNGTNSLVTVNDSASLHLTTAMTLEAWVNPSTVSSAWRDVIYKGDDNYYLEGTSDNGSLPGGGGTFTSSPLYGPAPLGVNTWSHLALTYDGAALRLYVNGVQVASRGQTGAIATSTNPLQIGGDSFYGQYWVGLIDEVRVYNRALSATEIQSDMTTPIGEAAPDTTPPTVSITSPISDSTVSHVTVISAAATDNVAVVSVEFFVDGVSIGTDIDSPYYVQWNTTTEENIPHSLTAVARDAAGNQTTSAPITVTTLNPVFVNEVVVPDILAATTIAFLPDGRMLVGELTESVWVVQPGANLADPIPFLQLDSSQLFGEQGLMDILPDPNFAQNGYFYVFYTRGFPGSNNYNRVSRFTASGNGTVPGSEVVLWQDDLVAQEEHHGGTLAFGTDGKLYISYGDQFIASAAQQLDSYRGKILRINLDGSIPADNPFYDGSGPNKDEIWALGLRNPFRISIDQVTGRMYIGDVGGNDPNTAMEEVNLGLSGANYGWPLCEGVCSVPGTTDPIYSYPHNGRDASITGGFAYRGNQFPNEYDGSYFFADYVQNTINRLTFDADGNVAAVVSFWPPDGTPDGSTVGDPVKLIEGPDGSLYYVDIGFNDQHIPNPAAIRRIRYIVVDQPPVAVASANLTSGLPPLVVSFSSAGSFDPEGASVSYDWTFGDGTSSTEANPIHTYQTEGAYVARLTVSDGLNTTLSNDLNIAVGEPPTPTILSPVDGSKFRAGDIIDFSGFATDPNDGDLPESAFTWTILFHHESHVHPGGTFTNTTSGTLEIPTSGHDFQGLTSYQIILTVTDSTGLSESTSVTMFPDKVNLTFDTVPSGLNLEIDGVSKNTLFTLDDLIGFQHTITAPAQSSDGLPYGFVSWSDGGTQSHQIVVPTVDSSYVATFQATSPSGDLVAAYSFDEGGGTSVSDASGNGNTGTAAGATWTPAGRYGNALVFNGTNSLVTVNDSASLHLTTAMTLEAWVNPSTVSSVWRDVIYKGDDNYYLEGTSDNGSLPGGGGTFTTSPLYGLAPLGVNTWSHLALTYDGAALRLYVNGVQVGSRGQTGAIATSTNPLQIGGDSFYGQYFQGMIDEVRVYRVALTAAQIQSDMNTPIVPVVPGVPTVTGVSPPAGASGVPVAPVVTATFSEAMDPATINANTIELRDSANNLIPGTVTYDPATFAAALTPGVLASGETYTATIRGGTIDPRVKDLEGNSLTADYTWSFTTTTVVTAGFDESVVFSGLTEPMAVRFSPDGRVFVAEKSGLIKVFAGLTATTPTIFADLRTQVHNYWDRGLLGMALHPNFPTVPYVYVLYSYNKDPNDPQYPRWPTIDGTSDTCPTPPGPTTDGCVISGRLSRLEASGDVATGSEVVLIEDWGQQFPSHSIGTLAFGLDGALYVSGGDGASFTNPDYGQYGDPVNPLGDPPGGIGGTMEPPTAEGGALRSQSLNRVAGPAVLDGSILRIDPDTGEALPDNPLFSSSDINARRIVGYGLRNPFRFAIRPGTNEVWVGDVGWSSWEEINRITDPLGATVANFGWPCYEGAGTLGGYNNLDLNICENLYAQQGTVTPPYYSYNHNAAVVTGDGCSTGGGSSISGIVFYNGGTYPANYDGSLFFADFSRSCIWVMFPGSNGLPDPTNRSVFKVNGANAANPVDLQVGPGGDLFYVNFAAGIAGGGQVRRYSYTSGGNNSPVAVISAEPLFGQAPLNVNFDASGSSDPDPGDTLTYSWDLDGDGSFGDATTPQTSFTYTTGGSYTVQLRVTDSHGASNTTTKLISVGNTPPTALIDTPVAGTQWEVGQTITFSGHATDPEQGTLPDSALGWSINLLHCPGGSCHTHPIQSFTGISSGSFSAPDHEYPAQIQIILTATDAGGLQDTKTINLDPITVDLTFQTTPTGLQLNIGSTTAATPFTKTVIVGSVNAVNAPSPQTQDLTTYSFSSWSDGGAQTHDITAGATPATYIATYVVFVDTTPPTSPGTLTATAVSGTQIDLSWGPATDDVGVVGYRVERCEGAGCTTFAQIGTTTGTTYNDNTGLAPNTNYSYRVWATDAAGNQGPNSNVASATTLTTVSGLVAAYSFDEGTGTTVADASGNGNTGTIANATWTTAGRFDGALTFNGTNARITIPDSASLHLTTGMTLEAWVNPSTVSSAWRDVIYKGDDDYYLEGTSDNGSLPAGGGTFASSPLYGPAALTANAWTHLALTYDGASLRLYVNGVQVASRAQTGTIATSTNPLQIGGDNIYGQYFNGTIDEVRVYNVALTQTQIQADMGTPIVDGGE